MRRTAFFLLLGSAVLLLLSLTLLVLPGPGFVLLPLALVPAAVGGTLLVVDASLRR